MSGTSAGLDDHSLKGWDCFAFLNLHPILRPQGNNLCMGSGGQTLNYPGERDHVSSIHILDPLGLWRKKWSLRSKNDK